VVVLPKQIEGQLSAKPHGASFRRVSGARPAQDAAANRGHFNCPCAISTLRRLSCPAALEVPSLAVWRLSAAARLAELRSARWF